MLWINFEVIVLDVQVLLDGFILHPLAGVLLLAHCLLGEYTFAEMSWSHLWLVTVYYVCCHVFVVWSHLDSFICIYSSIWMVSSFVLVWQCCHGYTALCLKVTACGFCWCASSWWNICLCCCTITFIWLCLKLALSRVMWAYNIMGNICERMYYNLWNCQVTYMFSTLVTIWLELLIWKTTSFSKF